MDQKPTKSGKSSLLASLKKKGKSLSKWAPNRAKKMVRMFFGAESFDFDISQWNIKRLRKSDVTRIFSGTTTFKSGYGPKVCETWNTVWGAKIVSLS